MTIAVGLSLGCPVSRALISGAQSLTAAIPVNILPETTR